MRAACMSERENFGIPHTAAKESKKLQMAISEEKREGVIGGGRGRGRKTMGYS
jgi:hypothetical protein